jgi:Leucine-rich repeat (LRR) protein
MSFNQLNEIDEKSFDNLVSLVNLNLRDNQLVTIPSTIKVLQNIERLDLSNNNLSRYALLIFQTCLSFFMR